MTVKEAAEQGKLLPDLLEDGLAFGSGAAKEVSQPFHERLDSIGSEGIA
jgi:hypothetical protein